MQLFYHPELDTGVSQLTFNEEESRHIVRVLRKKKGDTLQITNGQGYIFQAQILEVDIHHCTAQITDHTKKHKKMYALHLAVAPTKSMDRFEWFLEKATEIGVTEITPVICANSERKTIKGERLQKVVQAAMKQSLQAYLPKVNPAVALADFLERQSNGLLFIAHCQEGEKMELKRRAAADTDITVLIGPEGDFSPTEIDAAQDKGFLPVSLGQNRLRTETAAIVACATVSLINNR